MRALRRIRETGAWHYALDADDVMLGDYKRPKWEDYIRLFCDRHGVGRSTTFAALNVMDTWMALGLPEKALAAVGIEKAKEIRTIAHYDGRSGKLKLAPEEVLETLPPADTPIERVKKKIEEVLIDPPEPLTHEDVRASFTIDTGTDVEVALFEASDGNVWYSYEANEYLADGVLVPSDSWKKLDPKFKDWLVAKLKIQKYKHTNGKGDA
jgi:hypothetical protein